MGDTSSTAPSVSLMAQLKHGLTRENYQKAVADIVGGWRRRSLWGTMGLQDIRQRYRRSVIGPFWLTISMGVMVAALGVLYGAIFGQELGDYLPYLAAGFVTWGLVSSMVLDGGRAFISGEGLIKQLNAPLSVHVYRQVWGNLIVFLHNIWIYFLVAMWFGQYPSWTTLLVVPAIAIILVNGMWMGLLLGLLSTRFRDIPQIIGSVVQVMFFITPIIWKTDMLPGRALFLDLNPFYYYVQLVRAPMMGHLPSLEIIAGVVLLTVLGWGAALFFYTAYRWRLAYWV
ncbi:MAG: ABC transporter permease [Thiohalocapsa sp.]|nr:ABC transporter permease [Thiohalocapsa sp.]